jgi:hypothetical protein
MAGRGFEHFLDKRLANGGLKALDGPCRYFISGYAMEVIQALPARDSTLPAGMPHGSK